MALGNYDPLRGRRPTGMARTGTAPGMGVPNNNIAALNGGLVPQGGRPFDRLNRPTRPVSAPLPPPTGFAQPPMGGTSGQVPLPPGLPQPGPGGQQPPSLFPGLSGGTQGMNRPDVQQVGQDLMQRYNAGEISLGDVQRGITQAQNRPVSGPALPPEYLTPSGPVEDLLFTFLQGGPGGFATQPGTAENYLGSLLGTQVGAPGSQFAGQLAQGQIPEATQNWLNDILGRQRAQAMERFGASGAGRGSDVESFIAREQGQTINQFGNEIVNRALGAQGQLFNQGLANLQTNIGLGTGLTGVEQQRQREALANYLGVAGGLLPSEQNRQNQAFNLMFSQFLQQSGLPPEILALINTAGIAGAPNTTVTGQAPDPLATAASGFGQLAQSMGGLGGGGGGGGGGNLLAGIGGGGGGGGFGG